MDLVLFDNDTVPVKASLPYELPFYRPSAYFTTSRGAVPNEVPARPSIRGQFSATRNLVAQTRRLDPPKHSDRGYIITNPRSKPVVYRDFSLDELDTGDLLLFHSESWQGRVIELGCNSFWCHAALVVKCSSKPGQIYAKNIDWRGNDTDSDTMLCMWECVNNNESFRNVTDKSIRVGTQLVNLMDRLKYCQTFGVIKLSFVRGEDSPSGGREQLRQRILASIQLRDNTPYERDLSSFFWVWWYSVAWINCFGRHNPASTESLFCSELIAQTLMDAGVIIDKQTAATKARVGALASADFAVSDFDNVEKLNTTYIDALLYKYSGTFIVRWR